MTSNRDLHGSVDHYHNRNTPHFASEEIGLTTTIYYFSGTGNSLYVAKALAKKLHDCDIIPIARIWNLDTIIATSETIGFVFPMYSYGLPDIVNQFLSRVNLDAATYVFTVVTRGGAQGCALHRVDEILRERNYHQNLGFYVDMPSNMIHLHDLISKEKQKKLHKQANKKVEKIITSVLRRKSKGDKDKLFVRSFALSSSKSFLESVHKNDVSFLVDKNCIACGFCARVCPVDNIIMMGNRPQWQHHCQSCLACLHWCPKESIQYRKKTIGKQRYHHPDVTFKDVEFQKDMSVANRIPVPQWDPAYPPPPQPTQEA